MLINKNLAIYCILALRGTRLFARSYWDKGHT